MFPNDEKVPFENSTWLAGQSLNQIEVLLGKSSIDGGFSVAMVGYWMVVGIYKSGYVRFSNIDMEKWFCKEHVLQMVGLPNLLEIPPVLRSWMYQWIDPKENRGLFNSNAGTIETKELHRISINKVQLLKFLAVRFSCSITYRLNFAFVCVRVCLLIIL